MKYTLFLIILMCFSNPSNACTKNVTVMIYNQKMLPSLLDFSKQKTNKGQKVISIDCALYDDIKVGDTLVNREAPPEINAKGSIFTTPLEEVKYEIISK